MSPLSRKLKRKDNKKNNVCKKDAHVKLKPEMKSWFEREKSEINNA